MPDTQTNILMALSDALAGAVAKAGASTVLVDARHRFPASGVVYADNLVLTADHVVEREEDIHIVLPEGSDTGARLKGRDPGTDLALLELDKGGLLPAEPVKQEARIGQFALAVGRPTREGLQASLGVVSAVGGPLRTRRGGLLERFLRTDAIPYPGFSGGPLVDSEGRILGINTSGFAPEASLTIPAAVAWQVADAIRAHGGVRRGYLGVRSQPVEISPEAQAHLGRAQESGLLLVGIEKNSSAALGGLMVGDIITGVNGSAVADHDALLASMSGDVVGKTISIEVLRGGEVRSLMVTVGERGQP
ncbi:MAG: S1C family serine protease [Chloroflexi bacterium]|nr:S1C family serine protease [Chloroflexota bacterium]